MTGLDDHIRDEKHQASPASTSQPDGVTPRSVVDEWKATTGNKPPQKRTGWKILATILCWPAGLLAFIMAKRWSWFKTYFVSAGALLGLVVIAGALGAMSDSSPTCGADHGANQAYCMQVANYSTSAVNVRVFSEAAYVHGFLQKEATYCTFQLPPGTTGSWVDHPHAGCDTTMGPEASAPSEQWPLTLRVDFLAANGTIAKTLKASAPAPDDPWPFCGGSIFKITETVLPGTCYYGSHDGAAAQVNW